MAKHAKFLVLEMSLWLDQYNHSIQCHKWKHLTKMNHKVGIKPNTSVIIFTKLEKYLEVLF